MTIQEHNQRNARSKKMLLWFAIISMIMVFAGLTSAYIVSKSRPDWKAFEMPTAFFVSTIVILMSSITFFMAKKCIQKNNYNASSALLLTTLSLGILFVILQFQGFKSLILMGLYPTGASSTVNASFLYVLVFVHLVHLFGGIISLVVINYNHWKHRYILDQILGLELGELFWHFLGFLWLYLFLFLYFFK